MGIISPSVGRESDVPDVYQIQESPGSFRGKLDIYGIHIQGGAAEIPASSVKLERFARYRSVSLHSVFEQAGMPFNYRDAERIILIPVQDSKLLVKNQSGAVLYCGGQPIFKGQQALLVFGQKMTVAFEDEVSEYEVYYHNALDKADAGKSIRVEVHDSQ
jgi:hypothetical protein